MKTTGEVLPFGAVRRMATFAWNDEPMVAPSLVTRRWCKSRLIAYAKSRRPA